MITKIEASRRYLAKHDWLQTYHLFSFADYYDPRNIHFGSLRVFNDDTIAGQNGFPPHSHDNMEILTIVLSGELTHQDDIGNTSVIKAGEVQYMSAGSGVTHAEINQSDEPVQLYQIWILPRQKGYSPSYEQKDFSRINNKNVLLAIAAGRSENTGAIHLKTDATIYTSTLEPGHMIEYPSAIDRGVFVYLRSGTLTINNIQFNAFDQARVRNETHISIKAGDMAEFVLIDVPLNM